jgi:hypothetical protein
MSRVSRITSETLVLTLLLLAVPSLLAAQQLGTAPGQIPPAPVAPSGLSGIVMVGIMLAIVGLVGIAVILSDIARQHEEQALSLQACVSGALSDAPDLARLPIAATVHVPLWRPAAAIVRLTGPVPTPKLREAVVQTVFDKIWATWPSALIENRIIVEPHSGVGPKPRSPRRTPRWSQ